MNATITKGLIIGMGAALVNEFVLKKYTPQYSA
jgi:hypothetical protein